MAGFSGCGSEGASVLPQIRGDMLKPKTRKTRIGCGPMRLRPVTPAWLSLEGGSEATGMDLGCCMSASCPASGLGPAP